MSWIKIEFGKDESKENKNQSADCINYEQITSAIVQASIKLEEIKKEEDEKKKTGIKNLKISYNKVFGYYIEVSKGNVVKTNLSVGDKLNVKEGEVLTVYIAVKPEVVVTDPSIGDSTSIPDIIIIG